MGFNEELFTLALKPIEGVNEFKNLSIKNEGSNEIIESDGLPATNQELENKMTTKSKKIVLASVVGVALGVIIFIIIKNRK